MFVPLTKAACLPLNVDQSVELKAPRLTEDAVGTLRVITGVVEPLATLELRSVPVVPKVKAATLVTVPLPLLLKVVQSVELNAPRFTAEAVGIFNVITGVVVLLATVELTSVPVVPKVKADTLVTVPFPLPLNVVQSVLVK